MVGTAAALAFAALAGLLGSAQGLLITRPANITGGAPEFRLPSTISTWSSKSLPPSYALGLKDVKIVYATPADGCGIQNPKGLTNHLEMVGNIAMIDRGTCFFEEKIQNAEKAGALAVIVVNNRPGTLVMAGSPSSPVKTPSQAITQALGVTLKQFATNASSTTLLYGSVYQNLTKPAQKAALVKYYDDTGGKNWIRKDAFIGAGWANRSTDPCKDYWYGITCTEGGDIMQYYMDDGFNNMQGTLPDDATFNAFTGLTYWSIGDEPGLTGTLPTFAASKAVMEGFDFENTQISGEIPPAMLHSGLIAVNLQGNKLTGTIPSTVSSLSNCQGLYLSNNQLTGAIPDLSGVASSVAAAGDTFALDLSHNQFTSITGTFPKMTDISVHYNQLTGDIFSHLHADNARVKADHNLLNGTLPCSYDSFTKLRSLDLSFNRYEAMETCTIWDGYYTLSANNMEVLRLGNNPLSKAKSLAACKPAQIDLPGFNRSLSCASQGVTPLYLDIILAGNALEISMPNLPIGAWFAYTEVQSIKTLDFRGWDLNTHKSSDSMFDLTMGITSALGIGTTKGTLETLLLGSANLNGDIKGWDQLALVSVSWIDLSNNNMTGHPRMISIRQTLRYADLSGNPHLTGSIYEAFAQYENLNFMNLSGTGMRAGPTDPQLPSFLDLDYNTLTQDISRHHYCPAVLGKNRPITFLMDSSYNNFYGCQCEAGYRRRDGVCKECPEHAVCRGGAEEALTVVPHSYFPLPSAEDVQILARCRNSSLNNSPCNPESADEFVCAEGYSDRLCSKCTDGFFVLGFQCHQCGSWIEWVSLSFVVFAFIGFTVYVLISSATQWHRGTFNILIFYVQTSAFVLTSGLPVLKELEFIEIAYGTAFLRLIGVECFAPVADFFGRFYIVLMSPIVVVMMVFLALGAFMLYKRFKTPVEKETTLPAEYSTDEDAYAVAAAPPTAPTTSMSILEAVRMEGADKDEHPHVVYKVTIRVLVYAFKIMFFPICLKVFSAFHCPEDPYSGEGFMHEALYVSCDSDSAVTMQVFAVLALIFEIIGGFIAAAVVLFLFSPDPRVQAWIYRITKGRVFRGWFRHEVGMLYLCYKPTSFWAELYMLGRKMALALISSTIQFDSPMLPAAISMLLLASTFIHITTLPYAHRIDNLLESWVLCVILASYVAVVLLSTSNFDEASSNGLQIVVLLLHIFTFIMLVGILVNNSQKFAKGMLQRLNILDETSSEEEIDEDGRDKAAVDIGLEPMGTDRDFPADESPEHSADEEESRGSDPIDFGNSDSEDDSSPKGNMTLNGQTMNDDA
jgi:uncharacterized protein YjbI with pentapeptide repeats